ncbi:TetR family transcriptional regulator [Paeniglutamicibacter cryotolerans]|uniref:AcrR family transcriptional regulator n=1 Tax=Paeniglutamicibacter cryotolerans TaxID=670079 RepID=A0A839QJV7_9MICC|nr:AcrR family transcriptional regulator [Paeniglutamicibacter cryotolerans]
MGFDQGLRARKRAATERSIATVALEMALERGYEKVTVDMICETSMVSQRTFFNYFGSTEGVILGKSPAFPSEELAAEFIAERGSDVLGDLVRIIATAVSSREPDTSLFQVRRKLIQPTPS